MTSSSSIETSSNDIITIPRVVRAVRDASQYKPTGRTIVVCLDGTGDQFDADNSNIVHIVKCLKKADASQVTYYQSGIGTYDGGGLSSGWNAAWDSAVGSGLGVHVRDAYRFLMENYNDGDKICIYGFSRGAYTARCVAGMIHKVGLLPSQNSAQIPFAYEFYKDDSKKGWDMSADFKRTFCIDVNIWFLGLFDSVASVGFFPRKLPLSSTPTNQAKYFRHALALDERRAKFKSCQFRQRVSTERTASWKPVAELTPIETKFRQMLPETDVKEVWFAGCHADVGGGAVKNEVRHKLAQIPLRWMIRQSFECDTGILFKLDELAEEGIDVHTLWPVYQSPSVEKFAPSEEFIEKWKAGDLPGISRRANLWNPDFSGQDERPDELSMSAKQQTLAHGYLTEQAEDWLDSHAEVNDMLAQAKVWWILEAWPIKVRVQSATSGKWIKRIRPNLGRSREVQEKSPNLHWTVRQRIESSDYKLKVNVDRNADWKTVY